MNFGLALAEGQIEGVKVETVNPQAAGLAIGSPENQLR